MTSDKKNADQPSPSPPPPKEEDHLISTALLLIVALFGATIYAGRLMGCFHMSQRSSDILNVVFISFFGIFWAIKFFPRKGKKHKNHPDQRFNKRP